MNENEISIHVNSNSRIQVVQPESTTWKYKVKLNAEAASGGVLWKSCWQKFRNIHRKTPVLDLQILRKSILKTSANG